MNKIDIRQSMTTDEALIIDSWAKAYEAELDYKYPARWNWMLKNNPFLRDRSAGLPLWIAIADGKVVAWNGSMEIKIELNNNTYPAAFSVDTFTLPEYRGKKLALYLEEMIQNSHKIYVSIDMAPAVRAILYKLGERPGKPLSVYLKLIRKFNQKKMYAGFVKGVQAYFGNKSASLLNAVGPYGIDSLFNYIVTELFKRRQPQKRQEEDALKMSSGDLLLESIEAFGPESDYLWSKAGKAYSFAVPRDSVYLNWKYVQQPHLDYRKYIVKRNGEPCGLIVYRMGGDPSSPIGIICECISADNNQIQYKDMLSYIEHNMIAAGAQMIKCGTSVANLSDLLVNSGYRKIRTLVPMIHVAEDTKQDIDYEDLRRREWLMSLGDHDMDQIFLQDQPICADVLKILRNVIPGDKDSTGKIL